MFQTSDMASSSSQKPSAIKQDSEEEQEMVRDSADDTNISKRDTAGRKPKM